MPDLSVPYYKQSNDYYCGPASAQMMLDFLRVALPDQDALYNHRCHSSVFDSISDWLTAPDGLAGTLHDYRPVSLTSDFCVAGSADGTLISRKIAWTIHQYSTPVPFLKWGTHWVVVRGFEATALPNGPDDCSYEITAFWLNDPEPPATLPAAGVDFDMHVPYATDWQRDFLGPVNLGHWKGQVVAVCDSAILPNCVGSPTPPRPRLSGDRLVTHDEARDVARNALQQYGLFEHGPWKRSLANTLPGDPVLVQRLDRLDDFYYIVPMQDSSAKVPVLVCIDARFGDYLQSVRISGQARHSFPIETFDPQAAKAKLMGQTIDLGRKGRVKVRNEAHALYPTLVWKPCRESLSPYMPFFMVVIGDVRIFIRTDGKIFNKLHPTDRGN
jgi:hypothetical protein